MIDMSIFRSIFDEDIFSPIFPTEGLMDSDKNESLEKYRESEDEDLDELGDIDLSKTKMGTKVFGSSVKYPLVGPGVAERYQDRPFLYRWTNYSKDNFVMKSVILGPQSNFPVYRDEWDDFDD